MEVSRSVFGEILTPQRQLLLNVTSDIYVIGVFHVFEFHDLRERSAVSLKRTTPSLCLESRTSHTIQSCKSINFVASVMSEAS